MEPREILAASAAVAEMRARAARQNEESTIALMLKCIGSLIVIGMIGVVALAVVVWALGVLL